MGVAFSERRGTQLRATDQKTGRRKRTCRPGAGSCHLMFRCEALAASGISRPQWMDRRIDD